jgi:hypothetical protein
MEPVQYSPDYWLALAEECHASADRMVYPSTKRTMLRLAIAYERLARHAGEQTGMIARIEITEEKPE